MNSEHLYIRIILHPVSYIQLQSCKRAPMQSDHPEGILCTLHGFPQRANFPCRCKNARCLTEMPSRTAAKPAMECYRKRILRGWAERRNGFDHICSPRRWRVSSFSVTIKCQDTVTLLLGTLCLESFPVLSPFRHRLGISMLQPDLA